MSDEYEHSDKFDKHRIDISIVETSEEVKKPENKLLTESQLLKVCLDETKKHQNSLHVKQGIFVTRLDYPNKTPSRKDVLRANKVIENANIVIFVVEVNTFRSAI